MVSNRAFVQAMSQISARRQRDDISSHQDSDCAGDQTGLLRADDPDGPGDPWPLGPHLLDPSRGDAQHEGPYPPRPASSSGGCSRNFKIGASCGALAVGLLTGVVLAALVFAPATQAHSGDGALEAEGHLNMRAFSGRLSAAALPALRKAAGLAKLTDDDLEHAEALAFLNTARGKPQDGGHRLASATPATMAAVLDAQRTLGIFAMKSSTQGGSVSFPDSFPDCAPVAGACGEGVKECCGGGKCSRKHGGRCVLKLPAAVPQDLVNGSSKNASLKEETNGSSKNASLKEETVEKRGAAKAAGTETTPEASTTTELPCAESGKSCLETGCCAKPGHTCYRQNKWWASCNATCSATSSWDEKLSRWVRVETGKGWDCAPVVAPSPHSPAPSPRSPEPRGRKGRKGCAASGKTCAGSRCCSDPGLRCFRANKWWASCNATCSPRRKWDDRARAWVDSDKNEWDCEELVPRGGAGAEEKTKPRASAPPEDEDDLIYMK